MGVEFTVDPAVRLPWNAPRLASDGFHALQQAVDRIACTSASRHRLASISTGVVPPRHETHGQGTGPVFELCIRPEQKQGLGENRWLDLPGGTFVTSRR
jgi:hypothetical protein